MGDFRIKAIQSDEDRNKCYRSIISDIHLFDQLLENNQLDQADNMIGAEQELCIVDKDGRPSPLSIQLLEDINDEHYTNELALFNLEINCDPMRLGGNTFTQMENHLQGLMDIGQSFTNARSGDLYLTGILPTLKYKHLDFSFMTPEERYRILSNELLRIRGDHFQIHLEGVEEIHARLDSVLFEACNTSFQAHLQVNPGRFAQTYNWAQMISGPVLAVCTNSPLLFGRELWHENRIALFKQSLDTRSYGNPIRRFLPRVSFGTDWHQGSASKLWKNAVARFPLLLTGEESHDVEPDPNRLPSLKSVRLLNGTTYTWNRLCYGVNDNHAHIRIECRYMPAGPTIVDEIANLAFWVGLMHGMPKSLVGFEKHTPFRLAKDNFIRAARTGIHSNFNWFGKYHSAKDLLTNELIPMAADGLSSQGVSNQDINKYLGIIKDRVASGITGSEWTIQNYRTLRDKYKSSVCNRILVTESLKKQNENTPVHTWDNIHLPKYHSQLPLSIKPHTVEDIMNTEVFTINENASIELALQVMEWNNINHLVVENNNHNLTGIISTSQFDGDAVNPDGQNPQIKDVMTKAIVTVDPETMLEEAKALFKQYNIHCLPVLERGLLVGIITDKDFKGL